MKESPKYLLGVLTGLATTSYALADLFLSASNGLYGRSVIMALVAWISYVSIHYVETGRFVDPRIEEKKLPESDRNWMMLLVAAFLFSAGMSAGSVGVARENIVLASSGAASLIIGYFLAHYEFTDVIV